VVAAALAGGPDESADFSDERGKPHRRHARRHGRNRLVVTPSFFLRNGLPQPLSLSPAASTTPGGRTPSPSQPDSFSHSSCRGAPRGPRPRRYPSRAVASPGAAGAGRPATDDAEVECLTRGAPAPPNGHHRVISSAWLCRITVSKRAYLPQVRMNFLLCDSGSRGTISLPKRAIYCRTEYPLNVVSFAQLGQLVGIDFSIRELICASWANGGPGDVETS